MTGGTVLDFNAALTERELDAYLRTDEHDPTRKDKVLAGLNANVESFVAWLFPAAIITPRNARVGNIHGSPGTSLTIETKGDKRGLWKDFADPTQKGGNLIDLYMAVHGVPFVKALNDLAEWVGHGTRPEVNYQREQLARRLKRVERDLGPQKGEWHYTDADGQIIAAVYRYEPDDAKGGKEFLPWDAVKGRYGNPDVRPLYNLPGLLKSRSVVLVEGEKAAEALIARGIVATCVMGGCNSPLERTDLEPLRGKEVVLWPDNDEPGRKFAMAVAVAIAGIAASVRIIEPPADAPAGWDAADCDDPASVIGEADEAEAGQVADQLIQTVDAFDFDECDIPVRPWIVPGVMLSGYTHMLVAPGGSGKSLFTLQMAIALATGEQWGEWQPRKACKTLLINVEDDLHEQRRRLAAARHVMQPDMTKLVGMIHLAADPESIIIARADPNRKAVIATPIVAALRDYIKAHKIDVLVVDPFAETFEGDENSNSEIKWAMRIWRDEIAKPTGCAVYLVHHTTKGAANGAGDADIIRGAGAIVNSTRISATLMPMTEAEAENAGINPHERHLYVRYDDAKANQSLKTGKPHWFEKISVQLENGTEDSPADEVGALRPWRIPTIWDGVTVGHVKRVQDAVGNGRWRENQQANEWVGHAVADALMMDAGDPKDRKSIAIMVREWIKNDVLRVVEDEDAKRMKKKFVVVGKWITE